jgi:lysophospholipase L1-like esterase
MKRAAALAWLIGCVAWASPGLAQAPPDLFAPGDRWSAIGDSITQNGTYHHWVWLYYLTRFQDRTVEVANAGLSGDSAAGALRRLEWDILAHRPTVATVMFGMNDVNRRLYEVAATPDIAEQRRERIATYKDTQRALVKALQAHGARVVLLTPSIFDQTAEIERPKQVGVNDALGECATFLKTLAAESRATLVDFHSVMSALNAERQKTDPKFTIVGPDRVHPGPPGHLVMTFHFLMAQRVPPDVSRVMIDAKKKFIVATVHGTVEGLRVDKKEVAFTWTAKALPFPIPADAAPALEWVPFMAELNQEVLQVIGLREGRYAVQIDGEAPLGPFSDKDLERGVNLALEPTPQRRQAHEVLALVEQRRKLIAEQLRGVALVEHQLAPPGSHPTTLAAMKPLVEARLLEFKANAPAPSVLRATELYAERKPLQAESVVIAGRLADQARKAAVPKPHAYLIRQVD